MKFNKGDKVKFDQRAQKKYNWTDDKVHTVFKKFGSGFGVNDDMSLLDNQQGVIVSDALLELANEITEESKIKDIIPEDFKFSHIGYNSVHKFYKLYYRPKEKTFKEYVEEYLELEDNEVYFSPEQWPMKNKIDLIWYIVDKKGGKEKTFFDILICIHTNNFGGYEEYGKLFPQSFVRSINSDIA